jgi:molybdopterin synthase catalytic subunit
MRIAVHIFPGPLRERLAWPTPEGTGALVQFEGIVRPGEGDRTITALEYEAYHPMAIKQLDKLAADVISRYGLLGLCVEHSVGAVGVGECSFRLRIAAAHRKEALRAMDEFIDRMKRDVPIFKVVADSI